MEYLIKRYVGDSKEEHESLYYKPLYDHFGDNVSSFDYIVSNGGDWKGETSPIEISYIESLIEKLKTENATHMEIMFHCDHDSYIISGLEIRKPTKLEIDEHIKILSISNKNKLECKKLHLLNELKNIEEELKKIS